MSDYLLRCRIFFFHDCFLSSEYRLYRYIQKKAGRIGLTFKFSGRCRQGGMQPVKQPVGFGPEKGIAHRRIALRCAQSGLKAALIRRGEVEHPFIRLFEIKADAEFSLKAGTYSW